MLASERPSTKLPNSIDRPIASPSVKDNQFEEKDRVLTMDGLKVMVLNQDFLLESPAIRQDLVQMIGRAFADNLDVVSPRFRSDMDICSEMGIEGLCAVVLGYFVEGGDQSVVASACLKRWDASRLRNLRDDIVCAPCELSTSYSRPLASAKIFTRNRVATVRSGHDEHTTLPKEGFGRNVYRGSEKRFDDSKCGKRASVLGAGRRRDQWSLLA